MNGTPNRPAEDTDAPGKGGGLAALFELHRAEIIRFLRARCGDSTQADDLIQELWIKLDRHASGPIANGRAYLFRMANNLVLDSARARQRAMARDRQWLSADDGEDIHPANRADPSLRQDEALAREQEEALVRDAVSALPTGAQRALRLHRFEGLGHAEVANIMGISRSGVEKHLAVAMKNLRASLADCGWFVSVASQVRTDEAGGTPETENGHER
ncbi:RNA polymerase sigma factor [Sphingobium subterraneum]|uniref:RNA polymerase sigma-70 factor (ECF subfamily) n=1 Tax=Sphingobium subterraneum TaxID=627688 RepID=A0A841J8Y3_9SPHN|nr:sigma-70 family RNA polymerase sigma factor [Sphingobium subterraneum]MBB6124621.1 RNA polymerase sigma-70 factor (ECF subfamily) [Sphingobium subterraneum]